MFCFFCLFGPLRWYFTTVIFAFSILFCDFHFATSHFERLLCCWDLSITFFSFFSFPYFSMFRCLCLYREVSIQPLLQAIVVCIIVEWLSLFYFNERHRRSSFICLVMNQANSSSLTFMYMIYICMHAMVLLLSLHSLVFFYVFESLALCNIPIITYLLYTFAPGIW